MSIESVRIAIRGVFANRMRSALTMLGILIGVSSVIILVAVGSGSAAANREQLEALGSNTLTVLAGGFGPTDGTQTQSIEITDGDVEALQDENSAPDVKAVIPTVSAQGASVSYDGATTDPDSVSGTTANYSEARSFPVEFGRFFTQDELDNHRKVVVLGPTVVKNLLGETADLSAIVGQTVKVGSTKFQVIGVFDAKGSSGFQDQDSTVVMPLTTIRDTLTGNSGTVDQLTVQADSREATTAAQNQVQSILSSRHDGTTTSDFTVLNSTSVQESQDASNRTFTVLLGAVAAISLLVGGIGVMNIMLVTVTERTREIGIRKAIGAQRGDILGQFLTEAVLLSSLGGVLGIAVGIIGSRFEIVDIQPVVEPYSIALAFGVAMLTGLFFGIYPANRAAAMAPIDALRHE